MLLFVSQPAPTPGPTPNPAITLEAFEACSIPLADWNHRAHLTIAYLLLRQHPLEEATDRMRRGVQRFNLAKGIEQTPTGGYHETLTVAWMRVLHTTIGAYGGASGPEEFFAQHPHLLSKVMLRLFYTRPRIMSSEARYGFVEPDLAPLPSLA
jgi:hypothetical protein